MKATIKEKILEFLARQKCRGYDDDQLSEILKISPRQSVNIICRGLVMEGKIIRAKQIGGKIQNFLNTEECRKKIEEEGYIPVPVGPRPVRVPVAPGLLPEKEKITFEIDFADFTQKLELRGDIRRDISKAFVRYGEGSYGEAIINCYLVSEILTRSLFNSLYPEDKDKRIKHEDKLKRIWNDEEKEKQKEFGGIKVIASLLSAILWYRNKMGAHREMEPTMEGARITIMSLIQTLIEFQRLGINISS